MMPAHEFQSTHPGWGATKNFGFSKVQKEVSIHAPRVGCDLFHGLSMVICHLFQSTHPGWGATEKPKRVEWAGVFQSTHPGWGATSVWSFAPCLLTCFNPRTPGGVRHTTASLRNAYAIVSIHAPRVGCDRVKAKYVRTIIVSIHAPRVGCDEKP